jgi:hypothetical protein
MKTILAVTLLALVLTLGAALASADAGSTVQGDLTQLAGDISAAHATLIPDFDAISAAAQKGDKAAVVTEIKQARADAANLLPAIGTDRSQLVSDLKAARGARLTGLGAAVESALAADKAAIADIRDAAQQARNAVQGLRASSATGTTSSS